MEESTMIKIAHCHAMHNKENICFPKTKKLTHYLRYGKGRAPLVIENVKANSTSAADVRVENLCAE